MPLRSPAVPPADPASGSAPDSAGASGPDRPRTLVGRWAQLLAGLAGWGLAATLMIRADLGLGPWDAFHVGVHLHTGIGVGMASIATGATILLLSLPFGLRPGLGTLANMVGIGACIDLFLPLVPVASSFVAGLAYFLGGVGLAGWFTGVYVAAGLGKGPRDGLVLALAARLGWTVRRVRTLMELSVLGVGWALGGPLGVGTVLFALTIGPAMQWGLRRWDVLAAPTPAVPPPDAAPLRQAA